MDDPVIRRRWLGRRWPAFVKSVETNRSSRKQAGPFVCRYLEDFSRSLPDDLETGDLPTAQLIELGDIAEGLLELLTPLEAQLTTECISSALAAAGSVLSAEADRFHPETQEQQSQRAARIIEEIRARRAALIWTGRPGVGKGGESERK